MSLNSFATPLDLNSFLQTCGWMSPKTKEMIVAIARMEVVACAWDTEDPAVIGDDRADFLIEAMDACRDAAMTLSDGVMRWVEDLDGDSSYVDYGGAYYADMGRCFGHVEDEQAA